MVASPQFPVCLAGRLGSSHNQPLNNYFEVALPRATLFDFRRKAFHGELVDFSWVPTMKLLAKFPLVSRMSMLQMTWNIQNRSQLNGSMDPASIIGIASGAATLVSICVQTVTFLTSISDNYKNVHLALWDLISSCEALKNAWTNVHIWLEDMHGHPIALSPLALEQLKSSLSRSSFFLELLQKDLERLFPDWTLSLRLKATQRSAKLAAKLFQHQNIIRSHCERINHQSTNLILLLNTVKLWVRCLTSRYVANVKKAFRSSPRELARDL
jgi:hypothetical protein